MAFLYSFCGMLVICSCVALSRASINDHFKYWETLTVSSIQRRIVKRDIVTSQTQEEIVKFNSFGRQFALLLRKDLSILASGFKLFVYKADGKKYETQLNLNLYRGTVEGDDDSFVSAYFDNHQVLSASIQTSKETYTVEPASNLSPGAPNDSMIIYKGSDFKWNNNSRCGFVNDKEDSAPVDESHRENEAQYNRSKRRACNPSKNTCTLYLVADPLFYTVRGKSSVNETATYMLKVIDFIDRIYRTTYFPTCGKNFGFEVKIINVFERYIEEFVYTNPTAEFNYRQFLDLFSNDKELKEVCLGHLFTYRDFNQEGFSVMGIGFLASPQTQNVGGVCGRTSNPVFSRNSGWTTHRAGTATASDLQATLVTAHEFGHNWGSPHDPEDNLECSPPASSGGSYVMYPISVSGRDKNNKLFSPCSATAMGNVLSMKSACFVEKEGAFCGNYRLEAGEECDAGFTMSSDDDRCCTRDCKLRPNAQCSAANHACCTPDCQIMTNKQMPCYMPTVEDCFLPAFCDGVSSHCPASTPKPNGSFCSYKGECWNGRCIPLCRLHNYSSCMCDTMADGCKWCCRNQRGTCSPLVLNNTIPYLGEGTTCVGGMCDNRGRCIASVRGFIARLWQLLDLSSPGAFVKFMRNNIVSTIIILSLILWIPVSCYICYLDRREERERLKMIDEAVDDVLKGKKAKVEPPSKTDSRRAKMKKQIGTLTNQAFEVQETKDKPTPHHNGISRSRL